MTVTMTETGLDETVAWANDLVTTFKQAAASENMASVEESIVYVEDVMPVLTGWARSRFGDPLVPGGILDVRDDGLTVEYGSDLSEIGLYEYITRLNEGSSKQAPAGFIDVAAEHAGDGLESRLNEIADMVE